jgi:pimeloyl-ACP methyl ester carboxylesterase
MLSITATTGRQDQVTVSRFNFKALLLAGCCLLSCSQGHAAAGSTASHDSTFAATSTSLPPFSRRVENQGQFFHVRTMQPASADQPSSQPVLILLSGPNQNYHADSAWFALLQPLLAQHYQVHAIDRLGNGFSDDSTDLSYRRFADDLAQLLPKLSQQPMIIISFASGSISSQLLYQRHRQQLNLKAMIWLDPDVATAATVALYQGYPVDWYQQNLTALLPKLAAGSWQQRTADKLAAERQQVQALVPAHYQTLMDWDYFAAVLAQRQSVARQQARAREIAAYAADLQLYLQQPLITTLPVTVIDSDFETAEAAADPAEQEKLLSFQQQSTVWNRQVAAVSGGQYIATGQSQHLLMLQQPELVLQAVQALAKPR